MAASLTSMRRVNLGGELADIYVALTALRTPEQHGNRFTLNQW